MGELPFRPETLVQKSESEPPPKLPPPPRAAAAKPAARTSAAPPPLGSAHGFGSQLWGVGGRQDLGLEWPRPTAAGRARRQRQHGRRSSLGRQGASAAALDGCHTLKWHWWTVHTTTKGRGCKPQ
jgi:hypothetical protein